MKRLNLRWPVLAICLTVLVAFVPFCASPAFAQATSSGTITGTVTDSTGAFIPEATITAYDPSTKSTRTTMSNKSGQFTIQNIQTGVYDIKASKGGFSTDQISGLAVSVGTQTTANFKMAVGAESTTVEVQASNADVQTMNAGTGTTVDSALVDNLPAIGREAASFVTMQPGVTPQGNVAGTASDQATFTLDGGSNSSDMDGTGNTYLTSFATSTTGGAIGAGTAGVMPTPQDSVEEFKVATTGQTADFNNSSGFQAQIVTKRGRDKIHGSVYEYYLDNNFNANSWQNNFTKTNYCGYNNTPPVETPTTTTPEPAYCQGATPTGTFAGGYGGANSHTLKPDYHFSRFGASAGGPISPYVLGGKTYLFADFEGYRYPNSGIYERTIPSYSFLNTGLTNTFNGGAVYPAATLKANDPRGIGLDPTLATFYATQLPLQAAPGATQATYPGTFDTSCALGASTTYCDSNNIIGYAGLVKIPQTSNFFVARLDHDFGAKWHLMASYRYYKLINSTSNQVTVCGTAPVTTTPCNGVFNALTPRPQVPWFGVVGVTTNISSSLTNEFHYSYLRNLWAYQGPGDPPQVAGAGAAIEPFGDVTNNVLSPYNVNSQSTRTRTWDGKDNFFSDNVTKLKGDHLIQIGGQFQHNFNYHLRTDNGATINYQPLYLLGDTAGAGNIYSAPTGFLNGGVGGGPNNNWNRYLAAYYGFVTDTQVLNTYQTVAGALTLQPPSTPYGAHTTIPYYNIYATDTWRLKPSITINAGISYALEMPPTEKSGQETLLTTATGAPIYVDDYLNARKAAALSGTVYEPQIGFANVNSPTLGRKYAYDPFYAGVSPRVSASWDPKFKNKNLNKIFGNGATVIRGGYGRIFGRINGVAEVLNPLLSPPIILATQCQSLQSAIGSTGGTGTCAAGGYSDVTAARFGATSAGEDGIVFPTASAALPTTIGNVYRPGLDGPGIATASPLDPSLRPNDVDTINFSIQRQVNRRSLIEVGYIGRLIHHEYQYLNPNTVPYMMTLGGQSFQSAYLAMETILGCTTSSSVCKNTATAANYTKFAAADQPFFNAALGGMGSPYCASYTNPSTKVKTTFQNCTEAVAFNQASNLATQSVFSLWKALDNNVNGAGGTGFVFNRSLMGTAITSTPASYGGTGQIVSGATMATGQGYSNYHGGYASYKISGLHGITFQENLTFSKALGLAVVNQSSSSGAAEDSFNLSQQYGKQTFDQKLIFNTFMSWNTPWYMTQRGIIGRIAGGWTISPSVAAGTGQPQTCTTNNAAQSFGGDDGSSISDSESCIFTQKYGAGYHTHRGILGGSDSGGISVGTSVHAGGLNAAVNEFKNPGAIYDSTRPAILGLDKKDPAGTFQALPYLNLDLSLKKRLVVYKSVNLEATGVFYNAMNHMEFASPSLSIATPAAFGVTKTQGNSPRQIQMGIRANF
jgi:hypothetical protein